MMLDALARVALFRSIPADALSYLAEQAERRSFPGGAPLMRQGEPSDAVHVILSGRVRIERSHPLLTAPLDLDEPGPDEVVGELGLLEGDPRWATATAIEDTETLRLGRTAFIETMRRFPEASATLVLVLGPRPRRFADGPDR